MFERVLIANRGEIALRVVRACKDMGIASVAVYSQADEQSLHVQVADESICIGPAPASESYLKIPHIVSAAEISGADAIHPGYGFLAENAHFAEICQNCNITFIGPSPDSIRRMGDKAVARETMRAAGVPVTPGSEGTVKDEKEATAIAREMGYPVLVKAVAGGGGKGMRMAHDDAEMAAAFNMARNEAERAFGNKQVYIEKYIESARHIEVQVLGDKHGNVVHLGERDCSLQRRHQKVWEEAPSPAITPHVRKKLGQAAVKAAEAVNYCTAGTIEFLYDEKTEHFYFMEMNTRIQVEHPITEMITGVDLICEMIRAAAGEKLSVRQKDIDMVGHAIEFRVNAEDPARNFAPCPGPVNWIHFPGGPGVRVDSHVYSGYEVSPYYDSMIGKIIAYGDTRQHALDRLRRALSEFMIDGVATTVPLGLKLLEDDAVLRGAYNTQYLERFLKEGGLGPAIVI